MARDKAKKKIHIISRIAKIYAIAAGLMFMVGIVAGAALALFSVNP